MPHAGLCAALAAERGPGVSTPYIAEGAVALVLPQEVRRRVIGHVDVRVAVVIVVAKQGAEAVGRVEFAGFGAAG